MVINKYAKKILITREHDRADARVKREIGTGNIKDEGEKKQRECRGEILCSRRRRANEDKDEENVIIAR